MQKNSDLKLQSNSLKNSPIKKNFEYYCTTGNIWNSKYHSSAKISKYYLDPQESFLSGPLCPQNLSMIDSTEREENYIDRATKNKLVSRQRLFERKKERQTIQLKSKQSIGGTGKNQSEVGENKRKRPLTMVFESEGIEKQMRNFRNTLHIDFFKSKSIEIDEKKEIGMQIEGNHDINLHEKKFECSFDQKNSAKRLENSKKNKILEIKSNKTRKWMSRIRRNFDFLKPFNSDRSKKIESKIMKKYEDRGKKIKQNNKNLNLSMMNEILKDLDDFEMIYSERLNSRKS